MTIRSHTKSSRIRKIFLGAVLASMLALAVPAFASAWTVDSTGDQTDANTADTSCATSGGKCTLRAAIEQSNAEGGSQEILFSSSVFNGKTGSAIALGTALPNFAPERGEINGISAGACTTTSGVAGPCVEIDGAAGTKVLTLAATGEMVVKGLAVTGGSTGIEAAPGKAIWIEENWIGKKLDGTLASATGTGINTDEARTIGNSIYGGEFGIHTSGADPGGNSIKVNTITGATGAGILIENEQNNVYGNQVSNSGIGIRIHDATVAASENNFGGLAFFASDPDENVITGSTGAAFEINTSSGSTNNIFRNHGSGNGGPFIKLVKKSAGESKGPNNGIQPPEIESASTTEASGTAEPEAFVRVYANATASEGELGTFLGRVEVDGSGEWSLTYTAPVGTATIAAAQNGSSPTTEDDQGSSALAFEPIAFSLKVAKGGTGSGTVTSTPAGINCGVTCEGNFAKGGLVKLLGTATSGSLAVVWAGCDAVNGAGECEVTMSAAKSVTATFNTAPTNGGGGDTGGGSTGGGGSTTPAPSPSPSPTPTKPTPVKKKPLKCKAGFKKKTVKGKARCVKVKKVKKKH